MKVSYAVAAAGALVMAAGFPGAVASANVGAVQTNVSTFDARADSAASSYCIDIPAVLIGQQICGGFLRSTVTATSDPRAFALGGLAPVPKLSSVPLLIPGNFQGVPVPEQVQQGLKQIKFNNIPSQCQASYPAVVEGDDEQTCGGPTYGDTALGFIGAGANAVVSTTGDQEDPFSTRSSADSRASYANLTGLQSVYDNVRALSESGLNGDGRPMSTARVSAGSVSMLSGAFRIDGIISSTEVAFDGTKEGTAANTSFKYGSASFAGIPVEITPNGLVLATEQVPADQAKVFTQQLNQALANANGFSVTLLPAPPISTSASSVSATSGGIQVSYKGSTGTDVVYTQTIGLTSAQVSAVPTAVGGAFSGESGSAASPVGGSGVPAGVDNAAGSPDLGVSTLPGLGVSAVPAGGALPATPGTLDLATVPGDQALRQVGDQALLANFPGTEALASERLKNIYPAFCLLLLAAFVATRFRRLSGTGA